MNWYEFLWSSMHGDQWVPCKLIAENKVLNEVTIRYYDDFIGEVEVSTEPKRIRQMLVPRNVFMYPKPLTEPGLTEHRS